VVDTILGREGTAHETSVIFEEFEKKPFEETGLSKDRFVSIDIGPIVGHLIVLKNNMRLLPQTSRGNREVKEYLVATLGPKSRPRCRELRYFLLSYAIFMAASFLCSVTSSLLIMNQVYDDDLTADTVESAGLVCQTTQSPTTPLSTD
jgi:hypothetical protein